MFLKDRDILFIHIPKTCGKLITNNMEKNSNLYFYGHYPYKIWKDLHPNISNSTIIFTFVRNPWDKMVSLYFYTLNIYREMGPFFSNYEYINNDFNEWLAWNYNENIEKLKITKSINGKTNNIEHISHFELNFKNQIDLLTYENGNINENITIIKYENFCENNNIIKDFFNKNNLVNYDFNRKLNVTQHEHYSKYYNDKSIQLIEKYFSKDIQMFNYKFETI